MSHTLNLQMHDSCSIKSSRNLVEASCIRRIAVAVPANPIPTIAICGACSFSATSAALPSEVTVFKCAVPFFSKSQSTVGDEGDTFVDEA